MVICDSTFTLRAALSSREELEQMSEVEYSLYMEKYNNFLEKTKKFTYQQIIISAIFYYLQRYEEDKEFIHYSGWQRIVSALLNRRASDSILIFLNKIDLAKFLTKTKN